MYKIKYLQSALEIVNGKRVKKTIYCNIAGSSIEKRLTELFPVSENDYFISENSISASTDPEKQYTFGSLEDLRTEDKDEVLVLFRPVQGCGQMSALLKELGYEEGKNYINIMHLLKRTEGGYI